MKKVLTTGLIAGVVLLVLGFAMFNVALMFLPAIAEEYYNPEVFRADPGRSMFYYAHPFIFGLALSWFWERFKGLFEGGFLFRGLEFGVVYGAVATLPAMWITYSALEVSVAMVFTWVLYGIIQAIIAGIIFAKMNP